MANMSLANEGGAEWNQVETFLAAGKETDSRIIEGLKRRDPGAMKDLYERYGRIVYSVTYRIVGHAGEAEEIVQEIFVRVWTRAHLIDDSRGTIRPWLLTLTRNLAIDHTRAAGFRNRPGYTFYRNVPAPVCFDPALFFSDRAERLRHAFADLPPEQRTVIEFAYFEGLSQTEISARMKKPLGTVKTWVRTALGTLRKSFAMSTNRGNASGATNGSA